MPCLKLSNSFYMDHSLAQTLTIAQLSGICVEGQTLENLRRFNTEPSNLFLPIINRIMTRFSNGQTYPPWKYLGSEQSPWRCLRSISKSGPNFYKMVLTFATQATISDLGLLLAEPRLALPNTDYIRSEIMGPQFGMRYQQASKPALTSAALNLP